MLQLVRLLLALWLIRQLWRHGVRSPVVLGLAAIIAWMFVPAVLHTALAAF